MRDRPPLREPWRRFVGHSTSRQKRTGALNAKGFVTIVAAVGFVFIAPTVQAGHQEMILGHAEDFMYVALKNQFGRTRQVKVGIGWTPLFFA